MANIGISLILGISTAEQLTQFLHSCIDNLVAKTGTSINKIDSDIDWSQEDYQLAKNFAQEVFRNLVIKVKENYDIDNELRELGNEKIQRFKECYEIRKPEIQRAVTTECLAKLDCPVVTDFDWKLKWVIGSSSLSSLREPILQMDFHTKQIRDEIVKKDNVNFEMNIVELNTFINAIEKSMSE